MSVESHDLGPISDLTALSGYGDSYVVPGDEVYVVAEDCDYIYLNTGSNPPADGFNIIKAVFLPGVWQRRSSSGGAGALRFNTVAVGAIGSGRLIDTSLSGLVDGTSLAWVESVKDTWRWDATSTLTADNITVCNPTANGVNPGRFIRELIPAPEWMTQLTWVIDPANVAANDENSGIDDVAPLATDAERQRRMGPSPTWNAGTYDLRYVSDLPAADPVVLAGIRQPNSAVILHGSMSDGEGQIELFVGAISAITPLNRTSVPQHSWELTVPSLPVSWTASGGIGARITMSNGANVGAKSFATLDLTAKTAKTAQFIDENTYTYPFSPAGTSAPTTNNIVAEQLTKIPTFVYKMANGQNTASDGGFGVIAESLDFGADDEGDGVMMLAGPDPIFFDGCIVRLASDTPSSADRVSQASVAAPTFSACRVTGSGKMPSYNPCTFIAGYSDVDLVVGPGANVTFESDFMTEAVPIILKGQALAVALAAFNTDDSGIHVQEGGFLQIGEMGGSAPFLWGDGNTRYGLYVHAGNTAAYTALTNVTLTGASRDFVVGGLTSAAPFDRSTNTFDATSRTTTWANLAAAIPGGFDGNCCDPFTGAKVVADFSPPA
jgi:hypothetical protein